MLKNSIVRILLLLVIGMLFTACPLITEEEKKKEDTYSITLAATPTKYGSVRQSALTAKKDQSINISAIPNSGYMFSKWTGDYTGTSPDATIIVSQNMNIIANFEVKPVNMFTLTTSVSNALHGSISRSPDSDKYEENTEVTLTANPATGYKFLRWEGDFNSYDSSTAKVIMDTNKTINAIFASISSTIYTVTNNQVDTTMGNVKLEKETLVENGDSLTITAVPNEGYKFTGWSGITDQSNPVTITVNGNTSISPIFEAKPYYNISVSSSNSAYGSILISNSSVIENGSFTVKAIPNDGYSFIEWQGDISGKESQVTINNVTSNMNIQALFKPDQWTILVHFAVDNDIDYNFDNNYGYVTNYIETLQTVESLDNSNGDNINILLLLDSYNNDPTGQGYTSKYQDGYYKLSGDTDAANLSNDLIISKGEINSGDPAETKAFIDWALNEYPDGNRIMYSVFNHGSGFDDQNKEGIQTYGIGFDDSANGDSLTHDELFQTTQYLKDRAGKKIDLFFPYACLMGGVELAYEVKDNADYILFSEELYPAEKWSYEALQSIVNNSNISSEQLGRNFCDNADYFFNNERYRDFTLSLIDLSSIDNLFNGINDYSNLAIEEIYNNPVIASDFNNIAINSLKMMQDSMYYYIDFGNYLQNVIYSNLSSNIKTAANNVSTLLNNSVIYHTSNINNSTGMTIYHNIWNSTSQYSSNTYREILDFGSNSWTDYITLMDDNAFAIPPDEYELDNDISQATTLIKDAEMQIHSHHSKNDVDIFVISGIKTDYYSINITNSDNTQGANVRIHVFDSNDNYFGMYEGYGSNEFFHPINGDIYLAVVPTESSILANYSIELKSVENPPIYKDFEENDSFNSANLLEIGTKYKHDFYTLGDVDYMKVNLTSGERYKIETYPYSPFAYGCDTKMYIYDSSFNEIHYNDDKNQGLYSKVIFDCSNTDLYYIKITEYSDNLGDYIIDVTTTNEPIFNNSSYSIAK